MNTIKIPRDDIELFGEVVKSLQQNGLRYSVVVNEEFIITVTGY